MGRPWLFPVAYLLLITKSAIAFEVEGTIKKIDADGGMLVVQAGGQERNVAVAPDARILDAAGKVLVGGLKAKELREGTDATFTLERGQGRPIITSIQLGKRNPGSDSVSGGRDSVGLKPLTEM